MNPWADPFNQEQLLILLRQGHSLMEATKAMGEGLNVNNLRDYRKADPTFEEQVQMAMSSAFNPVMRRLVEQARHGDEADPATLKAWELVVRHYNKALDREHRHAIVDHQADRMAQMPTSSRPAMQGPDNRLVEELLDAIKEATNEDSDGGGTTDPPGELPETTE